MDIFFGNLADKLFGLVVNCSSSSSFNTNNDSLFQVMKWSRRQMLPLNKRLAMIGSMADDVDMHQFNGKLYNALMREDGSTVIDLCNAASENALHILTIHRDTVLHMATYLKQGDLVCKLLENLPHHHLDKMTRQNDLGNTILHDAATTNQCITVAKTMLQKAPGLLCMRNHIGETALFRVARYGSIQMFDFLADAISEYNQAGQETFLQRTDKTTVLHIAIIYQHFDLALKIVEKYEHLIGKSDVDGMTALQLLSCNQSAFKSRTEDTFLEQLTKSGDAFIMQLTQTVKLCFSSTRKEEVEKEKQRYKSAFELAKFLIKRDTSWEATYPGIDQSKPQLHKYSVSDNALCSNEMGRKGKTPLFLATKSGFVEIVEEILRCYPQAVEHIDHEGQNILHVAIKYRQLKIFKLVKKMGVPMWRLVRKVDNKGNSILHMVGKRRKDYVPEKMQSPLLELREELLWFERVKKVTLPYFLHHQNHIKQTADGLFESSISDLRKSATEWLKRSSKGCSIVAVLIATVAFAAAYGIPGGPDEETGFPVLYNQPLFMTFTVSVVLCIAFALTSVVIFLSIATSSFQIEEFKNSLPNKLILGFTFLFVSVSMMMVSFGATVILLIHKHQNWTKISLCATTLLPVGLFVLSYLPLYLSLSRTYKYLVKKIRKAGTRHNVRVLSKITNFFSILTFSATSHQTSSPV